MFKGPETATRRHIGEGGSQHDIASFWNLGVMCRKDTFRFIEATRRDRANVPDHQYEIESEHPRIKRTCKLASVTCVIAGGVDRVRDEIVP